MTFKIVLIFLLITAQNTWGQMSSDSSRGQSIASDSALEKNKFEPLLKDMMEAMVMSCQENINNDCATSEKVKSLVKNTCENQESNEVKDLCYLVAFKILSSVVDDPNSDARSLYKIYYEKQQSILAKNQIKQVEEDGIRRSEEEAKKKENTVKAIANKKRNEKDNDFFTGISVIVLSFFILFTPVGSILIAIYPPRFILAKGTLGRVGSMETLTSSKTQYNEFTKRIETSVSISRTISLIKIGDQTFTNVEVKDRSIFDVLQPGNETALIFDRNTLVFASDLDEEIQSAQYNSYVWIYYVITFLILVLCILISFSEAREILVTISILFLGSSIVNYYQIKKQDAFNERYAEITTI